MHGDPTEVATVVLVQTKSSTKGRRVFLAAIPHGDISNTGVMGISNNLRHFRRRSVKGGSAGIMGRRHIAVLDGGERAQHSFLCIRRENSGAQPNFGTENSGIHGKYVI